MAEYDETLSGRMAELESQAALMRHKIGALAAERDQLAKDLEDARERVARVREALGALLPFLPLVLAEAFKNTAHGSAVLRFKEALAILDDGRDT